MLRYYYYDFLKTVMIIKDLVGIDQTQGHELGWGDQR